MNHNDALILKGLTKRYGRAMGIHDVSLTVSAGEVFGFIGPNGAGKTTTIRTIMNFLKPSSGSATILGLDSAKDTTKVKARVGYLAGDIELYDNLTARQYLQFMAELRDVAWPSIAELINRLHVTTSKKISRLSRGNKQKVGLVAALMHDPDLLILDEPTSGLDPLVQQQFYELIKEHTSRGKSVFISSHILSEVQEICDRVGFMRDGTLVETVDVARVIKNAKKQVSIRCKPGTKAMHLPQFKGLEITLNTKTQLVFKTSAPVKDIVQWLSFQPLIDVTIEDSNLDDIFLKLYGTPAEEKHVS